MRQHNETRTQAGLGSEVFARIVNAVCIELGSPRRGLGQFS
jgi:hypothetical protein